MIKEGFSNGQKCKLICIQFHTGITSTPHEMRTCFRQGISTIRRCKKAFSLDVTSGIESSTNFFIETQRNF